MISLRLRAHPRIRGEYIFSHAQLSQSQGSPPHTRGILVYDLIRIRDPGLTPAYAGNTHTEGRSRVPFEAHPRIRGEYVLYRNGEESDVGSPPHTRGIPDRWPPEGHSSRLTPAYAGNTFECSIYKHLYKAHPRIRGEYSIMRARGPLFKGSPPHTRGIQHIFHKQRIEGRLTPAYAGNTPCGFSFFDPG